MSQQDHASRQQLRRNATPFEVALEALRTKNAELRSHAREMRALAAERKRRGAAAGAAAADDDDSVGWASQGQTMALNGTVDAAVNGGLANWVTTARSRRRRALAGPSRRLLKLNAHGRESALVPHSFQEAAVNRRRLCVRSVARKQTIGRASSSQAALVTGAYRAVYPEIAADVNAAPLGSRKARAPAALREAVGAHLRALRACVAVHRRVCSPPMRPLAEHIETVAWPKLRSQVRALLVVPPPPRWGGGVAEA